MKNMHTDVRVLSKLNQITYIIWVREVLRKTIISKRDLSFDSCDQSPALF